MSEGATPIADQVDRMIEERSLLKHPFYQAWQRGDLSLDTLRSYAQYYQHTTVAAGAAA